MSCLNHRLLRNSTGSTRKKQRYLSRVFDYYLREANNKKKSIEEVFDFNKFVND